MHSHGLDGAGNVAGLGDHPERGLGLQQGAHAPAHDSVIVDDQD